jgi:Flp pilus assembly CpaE family ATPase
VRSIGVAVSHGDPRVIDELIHAVEAAPDLYVALEPAKASVVVAGAEQLGAFAAQPPPTGVAVLGLAVDGDLAQVARVALRCRAEDIVWWPRDRDAFRGTVREAASRARLSAGSTDGKVVAVASARGGAGATTVAALIARALPESLIVDLDAAGGGQSAFLAPDVEPTLDSVLGVVEDLDPRGLRSGFVAHASGRALCAAPRSIAVGRERVQRLVALLRATVPYVVVDLGRCADPATQGVFNDADASLLVCAPDLQSMRGARAIAAAAPETRYILNAATRLRLSVRDVTRVLGAAPTAVIPLEPAVRRAGEGGRLPAKGRARRVAERLAASLARELRHGR